MSGDSDSPVRVIPVHTAVQGRVRFRVDGLHRNERLKQAIEDELAGDEGVLGASASVLTGTVLIRFQAGRSREELTERLGVIVVSFIEGVPRPDRPGVIREAARDIAVPSLGSIWRGMKGLLGCLPDPTAVAAIWTRPTASRGPAAPGAYQEQMPEPWHVTDAEPILAFLGSSRAGLPTAVAQQRLAKYGKNVLLRPEPPSVVRIFFRQLESLPVLLLSGSAVLSVLTGGFADAVVILAVVLLNATIGAFTELESERTITALTGIGQPSALVVRDGAVLETAGEDVVIGDVLVLARGCYVAADARLLEAERLSIDESALTGESVPAIKTAACLSANRLALGDQTNMAFRGTVVTGGGGLGVVVATGVYTEIGRVQGLMAGEQQPETPVQRQLHQLGRQLAVVAGTVCAGMLAAGLLRGYGAIQMVRSAISLAVAAIPEGLPTVATTTLALGVRRMRALKVLVRRLDAVETLGAVQMMCLDKTGTITMNRMTAVAVFAGGRQYDIGEEQFFCGEKPVNPLARRELVRLLEVVALCSEAELVDDNGSLTFQGTPTETALVQMSAQAGVDVARLRRSYPLLKIQHRSESRPYMATIHASEHGPTLAAVKGSPADVLALCRRQLKNGRVTELRESDRAQLRAQNERMAGSALRVLGVACADGIRDLESDVSLTWLGMVGLTDPPRQGLHDLITVFHRAGIRTVMITGDQSATAYAIGRELDLSRGQPLEILDSTRLEEVNPELLSGLVGRVHIYSRVNPAHKLQIVRAMQRAGKVVAMTGDGINDGPAMKVADIGVAMGRGAEVAREVADIVLLDDNISTMAVAIEQGRTIAADIKKAVHFVVATNSSEVLTMFCGVLAGLGEPLNPRQLLWINLLTDVFPELALAVEPPEPDLMLQSPRDPRAVFVSPKEFVHLGAQGGIMTAAVLSAYGLRFARYGPGPQSSTMAFLTMASTQLLHTITSRSERHSVFDRGRFAENRYVPMAIGAGFTVELMSLFVPWVRGILGTAPLTAADLLTCAAAAGGSFVANEMLKCVRRAAVPGALEEGAQEKDLAALRPEFSYE